MRIFFALSLLLLSATVSQAGVSVTGKGDAMQYDTSAFPAGIRAKYEIFRVKCVGCHSMERAVIALETGVAPISGQPFDRNAIKAYGAKMIRKTDSRMTKPEVKACLEVMNFILDQNGR
jgi:hypothetical protein